jgi:hypothetical protein
MTVKQELEDLAHECEQNGISASHAFRETEAKQWLSMCHRIRHAAKQIRFEP